MCCTVRLNGVPCREWTGFCNKLGYGQRRVKGKCWYVHRYAWVQANGPVPEGLCVLHHCDNPSCYEVKHLFLGTRIDNNLDRDQKRRSPRGEAHGMAKLTRRQVEEIRRLLEQGMAQPVIAAQFGISPSHVSGINTGRFWRAS